MAAPLTLHHHHTKQPFSSENPISKLNQPHPCILSLETCSSMKELMQIHAQMLRTGLFTDPFTAAKIVAFCAAHESGSLDYARLVFTQIPTPTPFTFNSIIRGFTNKGKHEEATLFYREMVLVRGLVPDRFTFPSLFKSCGDLSAGKQLHCHSTKMGCASDTYIQNTLMNMYSGCGCMVSARKVFDKMGDRTVVSWATMIGAYTLDGQYNEALMVFQRMVDEHVEPNEITLVNVLTACSRARDLSMAKRVHEYIDENGFGSHLILATALMDVYSKCACVSVAKALFEKIPEKNLFCWNVMINGLVGEGKYDEAVALFREMQEKRIQGDKVTMASLLLACTHLSTLELGRWLHGYIKIHQIEMDVTLGTALVDMYAKCGSIESALQVFEELPEKDVMTWTAVIVGLAMSGQGEESLKFFHQMQEEGIKPDAITFVGVLAACSHAGLADEGVAYFNSMSEKYGIRPTIEHYGGLVDVLGRAGRIAEVEELIRSMPMAPDHYVLGGLLGACRLHGNLEAAERAGKRLLELDPDNGGIYILLSNIYKSMKKWDKAKRIRELMNKRGMKKPPGCSLIEVDGAVHEFVKGDSSHQMSEQIYEMVEDMKRELKKAGYVAQTSEVLFEMDEEEKETELSLHSEKLAIAFGLISTGPGVPIRIIKNLRICRDCHTASKLISRIYNREIVVRDRTRFHHFKDGYCSCRDFW